MKKNLYKIILISLLALTLVAPGMSFAQVTLSGGEEVACPDTGFGSLLCNIQQLLNSIVPLLLALGVVYFVWGVVMYVIADAEEAKKKGRDHIIYGIIGFVIIISVWGLVGLVVDFLGVGPQTINIPQLVPTTTAAEGGAACDIGTGVQGVMGYVTCIIQNAVIPLMFALAIVFFIWGIIQYLILGGSEEAKRTQGRQHMIWGIIALAVMLGVWGLVEIVGGSFGLNTSVLPEVRPR